MPSKGATLSQYQQIELNVLAYFEEKKQHGGPIISVQKATYVMKLYPSFNAKTQLVGYIGTLILTTGVILLILRAWLFNFLVTSMLVLKPNSFLTDVWKKPPVVMILDFYFFNWTNPEEINDSTTKPRFEEIGPYRFIEKRDKVNVTWNDNGTVTYRQFHSWQFDETHSFRKLTDEVTTLNAVTLSALNQVRKWNYIMKKSFSFSLAAISPAVQITKPVGQLLFEGYRDPYIDLALTLPFLADTQPPFDKFGWFYTRNNSAKFDGVFNMATGTTENNLGELLQWNYKNKTEFYGGKCGDIRGSAGELQRQWNTRDYISIFSTDICREVKLDYVEDIMVKNIQGYKYSATHSMFDNGSIVPDNVGFCNGECLPSGMLNVSACRYGTPSYVSLPHFYGADPVYLSKVDGLKPEKSKHEMFMVYEPRTGGLLEAAARLQLNMMLFPLEDVTLYSRVPKLIFPLLWFEQKGDLPDDFAYNLRLLLNLPTVFPIIAVILILMGLSAILLIGRKEIIGFLFRNVKPKTRLVHEVVPLRSDLDKLDMQSKV